MNHSDILNIMPLDCFRILSELQRKQINNAEVARILNVSKSNVQGWKDGRMPNETSGRRLVALYLLYYPNAEVPFCVPKDALAHI